jgi:hypothetical protein
MSKDAKPRINEITTATNPRIVAKTLKGNNIPPRYEMIELITPPSTAGTKTIGLLIATFHPVVKCSTAPFSCPPVAISEGFAGGIVWVSAPTTSRLFPH